MAAPTDPRPAVEERLIAATLAATWWLWLAGGLYVVGPLLGWWLGWRALRAYYLAPILPEIARAVADPLSKIDKITLVNAGGSGDVGVSRVTGEIAKVIAQVPPVIEALTGLKLDALLDKVRGERPAEEEPPAPPAPGKR